MLITAFDEPTAAIIISKWQNHLGSFKPEPLSFCSIMPSRRAPISGVKLFSQSPISPFLKNTFQLRCVLAKPYGYKEFSNISVGIKEVVSFTAIKLSKNPVMHGRSKHIAIRYHFLRDLTKEGVVELKYCRSQDQVADIMTKPLKLNAYVKLRELIGVGIIPIN